MTENLIITPKTKVLQLIEAYPQLEDVLIGYVPAFEKLKNPLLRRTVASIATLQQAAAIGNVKVEDLINHLRKEVGQDFLEVNEGQSNQSGKPGWFNVDKILKELDAREMLERGEHPVTQVMADLNIMNPGEIYKLVAPFFPAPLIEKAASIGFEHCQEKHSDGSFVIYFGKTQ